MAKISAGLERAFATHGFAEPSVEDLRDAAGVSLRTLYKYTPSRAEMVTVALNHRHIRYMSRVFDDLPYEPRAAWTEIVHRVADWMVRETSHGCLFHAAVAAAPRDNSLRRLLMRHKDDVAERAARATGLPEDGTTLLLILEGLTQSWPVRKEAAVTAAEQMGHRLM